MIFFIYSLELISQATWSQPAACHHRTVQRWNIYDVKIHSIWKGAEMDKQNKSEENKNENDNKEDVAATSYSIDHRMRYVNYLNNK